MFRIKFSFGIWRTRHYRQCLFSRASQDSVVYASSLSSATFQDIVLSVDGAVAIVGAEFEDQVRMILFHRHVVQ
jgi:hypothetical protein